MTFADKASIKRHGQKQPPLRERENTIGVRDGNGADRDRIMGDPNPPRPINM